HASVGEQAPLAVVDLSRLAAAARKRTLETAAEQAQRSLDLSRGPLLRAVTFDLGPNRPGRLLLAIHHLVVDGVGWRILLEDLERAYLQLARREPPRLPAKTTSWKAWAEGLVELARSAALQAEAAYWLAEASREVTPLPVDDPGGENIFASTRSLAVHFTAEETEALLREAPQAYRTQVDDVLLTALARALTRWTRGRRVRVEVEGHGREEERVPGADLSRTVGWFTSVYPVVLELPADGGVGAALKAVKEQLRAVPGRGIGYGLLRHLRGMELGPDTEVGFNYLGQLDQTVSGEAFFALAPESAGAEADGRSERRHRVEVSGAVRGGRLELALSYSAAVHGMETMQRLAGWYAEELRALLAHCTSAEAGGYTPSDFPLAGLSQAELDALLGRERGVEDVYPLTPLQEGMLFESLYAPGSGVYVGQFGFRLEGSLDADALERAWGAAVERHEALRAAFAWEGGHRPVQVVRRQVEVPFRRMDWRARSAAEQQAARAAYLAADRAADFALDQAPLLRLALLRTGEAEHELLWTHHHLILDGWSLAVLFRDVLALYGAYVRGERRQLPKARRYWEYVAWLAGRDRAAAERYWRAALAGFAAPTPLPVLRGGKGSGVGEQGEVEWELGAVRTAALQEQVRHWGVTLSTLVQGAWGLLLGRYAEEAEVLFGATVSGRPGELAGVEEMVGLFINTLPVRVRVDDGARVREWLEQVQAEQAGAREHGWAPLVEGQRWSEVGAGLFESLVVVENYPVERGLGEGVEGVRVEAVLGRDQASYPLVLSAQVEAGLKLVLRYDGSRAERGAVERMLGHLETVLEGLTGDGQRQVREVSLLRDAERAQVLETWNATAADYPPACIHQLIAAQAARTPHAPAVSAAHETVTYAELERRANRLAHRLRRLGVAPEVRVGLCLERSVDLVVAVLGVLKAGGAYVPLDPAYPAERLGYLLADSGTAVLLAQAPLLPRLPAFAGEVLCLEHAALAGEPEAGLPLEVDGRNAAYVIYTSGSTGRPKGAVVAHASLANFVCAVRGSFGPRAGERVLALASFAFDIWMFEVLVPLVSGAAVRLLGREEVRDAAAVVAELAEASAVHAVPALMRQIVAAAREAGGAAVAGVRRVYVGGEAVPAELVAQLRAGFTGAEV
ncbi:MAG TPA: condensation domain-containing protein, partial [Longimicrobiaceae bacterium]|nr:condensation domain-containing protein [Longimicrobiaceae bacterium]